MLLISIGPVAILIFSLMGSIYFGLASPSEAAAVGAAAPELGIDTADIIRGVIPFIGLIVIGLLLMIAFPQIILWLPSTM